MRSPLPMHKASVLVAITSHNPTARLQHLSEVVRTLSDFPVARLDIQVFVNDIGGDKANALGQMLRSGLTGAKTLMVRVVVGPFEPKELTWAHKRIIPGVFLAEGSPYTHFVYLEDDMRFGVANFRYFLTWRPALAKVRLIPSFLRVEHSANHLELRLSDFAEMLDPATRPGVEIRGRRFIQPLRPYCAMYVLDRALARAHVASDAFDIHRSKAMSDWWVQERAAAGQCWAKPPPGFASRYVLPLDEDGTRFAPECWVPHLGGHYADRAGIRFGQVRADAPFSRASTPGAR
ncbi:hypothetical protein [Falsiroseomonas sp. HW251]|uniref:hypothetical protein n=1 Tax=Falsiroseomonas sp. HW251 TaxID=3390998 RepID=UPI003D315181